MNRREFICTSALTAALSVKGKSHAQPSTYSSKRSGPKIVFLGDSITAGGHYIDYVETWFLINEGAKAPDIVNLGLGSETVSGLSEAHHSFPRPFLHDRLDRVLEATHPDIVVACYGINCGIYHPFSEERFQKYQDGIQKLLAKVKAAGAELVLMTPPPYAGKVSKKKEPADGMDFGFRTPYKDYDKVMAKYTAWILTLESEAGLRVVDVRTPLERHMSESYAKGPIHPTSLGHELMAEAFLKRWGVKTGADTLETAESAHTEDKLWQNVQQLVHQRRIAYDKALLKEIGHKRPQKGPEHSLKEAEEIARNLDNKIEEVLGE